MKKKDFGYSKDIVKYLQSDGTIPNGSFTIQKNKQNGKVYHYWYYNKSKGTNRLIHLCSVQDKGNEENSFQNSVKILKDKLKGITKTKRNQTFLNVIDDYIERLEKEGDENIRGTERTKKTTQDIISHVRKLRDYVIENPISLRGIQRESFRNYFEEFVGYLIYDYKKSNGERGLSDNSIRVVLIHIQQFLDELVEPSRGKRVIKYHPITQNFRKNLFSVRRKEQTIPDFYTVENYIEWVEKLSERVRKIWLDYIRNPEIRPEKYTSVYFTSLLQLLYGFRIGEVVHCYSSKKSKDRLHGKKKSGYSYISPNKHIYTFVIYWKRKFGRVGVDYNVYSWTESDQLKQVKTFLKENHKKPTYKTNIVDVILYLYSDEDRLFPFDIGTLRKNFDKYVLEELELKDTGVERTHDMRDMMINFNLHTKGVSPFDLSQITRNSVQTMENYYIHTSNEISISNSEKLSIKNRISEVYNLKMELDN